MPALNYQKQFAPKVEDGSKRQTIRAKRKRPFKRGDVLYHYTGMRTKGCRKLGESRCAMVIDITITKRGIKLEDHVSGPPQEEIAQNDGFTDFNAMRDWFGKTHGLPFHGQLIRWKSIEKTTPHPTLSH
jgi:hypothetical protein